MKTAIVPIAAACCLAASISAAECTLSVSSTTPTHRFVIHDDGTATDSRTGLRWQRCPLGYELDNGGNDYPGDDRCVVDGAATLFDWQAALAAAAAFNDAGGGSGFTDWRVPGLRELSSIVEFQCLQPAINADVFPDTPAANFWSSTPYRITEVGVVDFQSGKDTVSFIGFDGIAHHLRLARGGD